LTSTCLQDPSVSHLIIQDAKNEIIANDWKHTLSPVCSHPSLNVVAASESIASSWNCYWDEALEHGIRSTKLIQNLYCYLSRPRPIFGERKCPLCSAHIIVGQSYPLRPFSHYLEQFNLDTVIPWLENKNFSELFKLSRTNFITPFSMTLTDFSETSIIVQVYSCLLVVPLSVVC